MKKKKIFYMLLPVLAISGMCVFSACDAKQTPETVNGASDKGCDNILISVPIWRDKWVNEKHFNLLLDAEVDLVVAVTGVENETFDTSRHMLAMASKTKRSDGRMIKVLVHSRAMTDEILDYTEEEIQEMLSEFKGHEALGGYHIVDEPYNVQPFTRVEKIIKNYDPERIADINFLQTKSESFFHIIASSFLQLHKFHFLCIQSGICLCEILFCLIFQFLFYIQNALHFISELRHRPSLSLSFKQFLQHFYCLIKIIFFICSLQKEIIHSSYLTDCIINIGIAAFLIRSDIDQILCFIICRHNIF